jgi:type IV secretory pathway VirB10-like protein
MKLDRLRAPALAATAVLVISGAGIAFAGSPTPATPAPPTPVVQTEPVVPDTDQLQQGDQTTPDAVGAAESATEPAAAVVSTTQVVDKAASETAAEAPDGSEVTGTEADGPGGHQDPAGQNVDHQFNGEE